jgi:hypothetical protein
MLYITGLFGWTGMPAAFQVITRTIVRLVRKRLTDEEIAMFVDDLMAVVRRCHVEKVIAVVKEVCTELLGSDAVEPKKTEVGRKLDFIGWSFDLDSRSVSLAQHNFLKTLYGFVTIDETRPVPFKTLERLCSWAARYGVICRDLKPFSGDLYDVIRGRTLAHGSLQLHDEAQRVVKLWRGMLSLLELDSERFSRPLETFRSRRSALLIEYDASLTGLGVIVFQRSPTGVERELFFMQIPLPYDLHQDSGFQNTVEFTAILMAVAAVVACGHRDISVDLRGDSRSSLAWAVNLRFGDGRSRRAALAYVSLLMMYNISVADRIFLRGVDNIRCDGLSRGALPTDLDLACLRLHHEDSPQLLSVLHFSNPLVHLEGDEDVGATLARSHGLARDVGRHLTRPGPLA